MKLMRNREVQRLLLLCLLGTALIAAAGFCAGIVPGVLALAGGLVLSGGVMGVTLRRYRAIAQLNQDIDRVLHGEESLPIVSNDEGELAILRSEVGKMTIRLREAADSQRRERLHLADAMADISHQLRTPLTALNLTVENYGFCFVNETAVHNAPNRGELLFFDLDSPDLVHPLSVVYKKKRHLLPAARAFVDAARRFLQSQSWRSECDCRVEHGRPV